MTRPRIAIAHDYLTQRGGAERVVLSMAKAFPDAAIYTTLYDPEGTYPEFADLNIITSGLNRVPLLRRKHRLALPFLASASNHMFVDADLIIASSSGWAHGFAGTGKRLVYCYSPARWLYLTTSYLGDKGHLSVSGTGSAFEHAANYHHTEWGYVDVHRRYPGITLDANAAFEALWVEADMTHIAQWPCPVLSVVDQALILALHAARGEGSMKSHADLDIAFTAQSPDFQAAVRSRAAQLGAELALAAALDELDDFRDDPAHDLWLVYSRGGTRAQEWRARWKATPDLSGRARVLAMLVGVNREYVAMELGHDPSRAEMRSAFWQRIRNGLGLKRRSVHLRPPQ